MPRASELYGRPWSDNEYTLVLDSYFRFADQPRHTNSPYVKELSTLLGRTTASIIMRLENYAAVDKEVNQRRKGLLHTSRKCVECFWKWTDRRDHLISVADYLRGELTRRATRSLFEDDIVAKAFGKYEILDQLGEGGFGSVCSCIDIETSKLYAIKIIRTDRVGDSEALKRFRREMQVLVNVRHSNIIQLLAHNFDSEEHLPAFVMELAECNLQQHMEASNPGVRPHLAVVESTNIFRSIISAVDALHSYTPQIIHRDINPLNILRLPDGRWVLADFGLAKFLATTSQGHAALTRTQVGLGTAFYAAPEQYRDLKRTDTRTDVYGLGMLLWELYTSAWPPPEVNDAQLSAELNRVFRTATQRNPAYRQQSIRALRDDFEVAISTLGMEPIHPQHSRS